MEKRGEKREGSAATIENEKQKEVASL